MTMMSSFTPLGRVVPIQPAGGVPPLLGDCGSIDVWIKTMRYLKNSAWVLLALSMMLISHIGAGDVGFMVSRLEHVHSFQPYEGFQLAPLAQTREMNIRLNNLEGRINRHIHLQSHPFLYLIKGQIELMVGDETKMIGAGNFVTIPQGILHSMQGLAPAYPPGGAVRSAWGDVPGPGG
jgi:Cupin domain